MANIPNRQNKKRKVFARDGGCCLRCGATTRLTLDHVLPYSLGGRSGVENLQLLCSSCNETKGARHIDYRWVVAA